MSGIGFIGLLTVCLIVLKLVGIITISWIWVFSPIWIAIILWVLFFAGVCLFALIFGKRRF